MNNVRNEATSVSVQSDGKIVVGGTGAGITMARYNSDGTLDATFGTGGIVAITFTPYGEGVNALAIQSDGKILVLGQNNNSAAGVRQFLVARFNVNGSVDMTFGAGGFVTTSFGGYTHFATGLAVQSNGKIIAAGAAYESNTVPAKFAIARFNADGSPDMDFGIAGKVTTAFSGSTDFGDQASSVNLTQDGKIVVAGTRYSSTTFRDFAVARYNNDGSLDVSFGTGGMVTTNFVNNDIARDSVVQSDGKIILSGDSSNGLNPTLVRYNSDGSLDSSFGGAGIVVGPVGINTIKIQPDGKIVTGGPTGPFPDIDIALARYNTNGSVDNGFGINGVTQTPIGNNTLDSVADIAFQPNGRLVVVGGTTQNPTTNFDFFVARYTNDNFAAPRRTPFDLDGDGKTDLSIFRPNGAASEWWWLKSSNGGNGAAAFGAATDVIVPGDYTGDGKADIAVWRPSNGNWFVLRSEDSSFFAFPFGTSGDTPVPADFDGDDKVDAAVFRESAVTWFINKSSGGTDIVGFGAAGDKPVNADYDGDGKSDIAIFRPSGVNGAEWWVRRSSNASVFALQFGNSTDKAVPGDFTGDGKADVAFWRPATGFWNVLRSEDFSYYAFPFGANGDVPVPGDYDGDGKIDAGVFRQPGAQWFVNKSTGGTLIQAFGITGDVPLPNAFVR